MLQKGQHFSGVYDLVVKELFYNAVLCVIVNIKTLADLHKSQTIAAETQLLCNIILYARVEYKVFFFFFGIHCMLSVLQPNCN